MTRNEFIATTAREYRVHGIVDMDHTTSRIDDPVGAAKRLADAIEERGFAPWQTPPAAPALSETERAVIDAAIAYDDWIGGTPSLSKVGTAFTNAVRALRAARGGAK